MAPADRREMAQLHPHGRVFHCNGNDGPYVELIWDGRSFRVTPQLLKSVPKPSYDFDQAVTLVSDPTRSGRIREIHWHFKEGREFYKIQEGRRLKSRRYWSDELSPVRSPEVGR